MGSDDIYGHKYIYEDFTIFDKPQKRKLILSYHFRENDGWTYSRRGPERRIIIKIEKEVNIDILKKIILFKNLDTRLLELLKEMIQKQKIETGTFDY